MIAVYEFGRRPRRRHAAAHTEGRGRTLILDRTLILGRRHLKTVLAEYVEHYNSHRPHRSLSQRAPSALDTTPALGG